MKSPAIPGTASKRTAAVRAASFEDKTPTVVVRPLRAEDFEFVRSLAGTISGYTTCPPYVLWMLTRLHGQFCAVAVAPDQGHLGYLLAMSASDPADAVFVWQLAVTFRGRRRKAQDYLASHLRQAAQARGKRRIIFTSVPNSTAERSVKALAKRIFLVFPQMTQRLPASVSNKEREYSLSLVIPRSEYTK